MATFRLTTAPAVRRSSGVIAETYFLDGTPPALAEKTFDASTVREALAVLDAHAKVAGQTGKSLAVKIRLDSGRAPNGWRNLTHADTRIYVNLVDG
jgi:hypothetical protein